STQWSQRIRSDRRGSKAIDQSDDAVAHARDIEIQKIAKLEVPEPQVTEKLGTMDRQDRLKHLKLDDDAFANKKIDPIPVIDSQIFVTEWDRDLPLHR